MLGSNEVPQDEAKGRWQCPQLKLEKYLSRPDYEATFRSLRLFTKDFRKMVLAAPGGFEPRDADSERDLNELLEVLRTERDLYGVSQYIDAAQNRLPRLFSVNDLLCHDFVLLEY